MRPHPTEQPINQPTLFEGTFDELRNRAEVISHYQGEVSADDLWLKFPNEWTGLNSWQKARCLAGDKRFVYLKHKRSIQPKSHGREIKVYRALD